MTIQDAARVSTDPKAYADEERFHAACARLRRVSPVTRSEVDGLDPFWAVTKHADVMEIARQPERWLYGPRPALGGKRHATADMPVCALVQMDDPEHQAYRRITVHSSFADRAQRKPLVHRDALRRWKHLPIRYKVG